MTYNACQVAPMNCLTAVTLNEDSSFSDSKFFREVLRMTFVRGKICSTLKLPAPNRLMLSGTVKTLTMV